MEEEKIVTETTVEEPANGARQELEALLNEVLPEEKRTGDVDQMALDYIKELGADAIYMNPIHKSYQNAGRCQF